MSPAIPLIVKISTVGTFLILLIGALYYARSVVLPVVLAVLIALTLSPLIHRLRRLGVVPAVSSILVVLALGISVSGTMVLLSEPLAKMAAEAPTVARELRERFTPLRRPFEVLNQAGREVEAIADAGGATAPRTVVVERPGLVSLAVGTLADLGTTLLATLLLLPFLLAAGDSLKLKLVRVLPKLSGKKRSLMVLRDIENIVSRYLLTVMAINAGLGFLVGIVMASAGMPSPVLWGIGAAFLNFIPYVGSAIGIALAVGVSVVTFDSPTAAAIPPLAYLALQIVEGAFVTPLILGRRLELSAVAILLTLGLTTWMWGIVGAIIAVPLLVVVKVFCEYFPNLSTIGAFLSAETTPADDAEPEIEPPSKQPSGSGARPGE